MKTQADYYRDNPKRYRENADRYRARSRKFLKEFKATLKCSRCSETHPACLDFHHRDPNLKKGLVSQSVRLGWSIKRIKDEIKKCDILCANCHRKEHATQGKDIL